MGEKKIILSPSLLACDFARAGEQLAVLEKAGITHLHLDVMDGIFVPNISFGQPVIKSLRKSCGMIFDVHLMITDPERYIDDFVSAGADIITIHTEACKNTSDTLNYIRSKGVTPGLSLKPGTNASEIYKFLPLCGLVLVMTVEPGFGGQSFMPDMLPKITEIKNECERLGLADIHIEVDGGIDAETAPLARDAGANMFVAGSSVFGQPDIAGAALGILKKLNDA